MFKKLSTKSIVYLVIFILFTGFFAYISVASHIDSYNSDKYEAFSKLALNASKAAYKELKLPTPLKELETDVTCIRDTYYSVDRCDSLWQKRIIDSSLIGGDNLSQAIKSTGWRQETKMTSSFSLESGILIRYKKTVGDIPLYLILSMCNSNNCYDSDAQELLKNDGSINMYVLQIGPDILNQTVKNWK